MRDYVPNEIIVTLSETDPAVLFDLNSQISRQLSKLRSEGLFERPGHRLDKVIDGILEGVFGDKDLGGPPGEVLRPVYRPVFIPSPIVPRLDGLELSDELLGRLQEHFGVLPPLYDIRIKLVDKVPADARFNSIKQLPEWLEEVKDKREDDMEPLFELEHEFKLVDGRDDMESGRSQTYLISFSRDIPVMEAVKAASRMGAHAEPNHIGKLCGDGWARRINYHMCQGDDDLCAHGEDVIVAIVDSGITLSGDEVANARASDIRNAIQPTELRDGLPANIDDLINKLLHRFLDMVDCTPEYNCGYRDLIVGDGLDKDNWPHDDLEHGTDIAWIIKERMAKDSLFLPIRAFFKLKNETLGVSTAALASTAITMAIDAGADVVNLSFQFKNRHSSLRAALVNKPKTGRPPCLIVALGNKNGYKAWPAAYASEDDEAIEILGVGGAKLLNEELSPHLDSNHGPEKYGDYVLGPFNDVSTYQNPEGWSYVRQGTSFATAFVSGLAAQIIGIAKKNKRPWSRKEVYQLIRKHAKVIPGSSTRAFGRGLIDVEATLVDAHRYFSPNPS